MHSAKMESVPTLQFSRGNATAKQKHAHMNKNNEIKLAIKRIFILFLSVYYRADAF